ncbi:MAG TPA: hypothetical protein P5346_02925 [Spirochaetota bacterium]|nr:hypothetical protein [Spirochaetota bacterium]HSA13670.1 hypothetical protein [Spirochaetota bacterium]
MASLMLNPVITSIRGTVGGLVFYQRNGKTVSRTWIMPPNPRTQKQQSNRARFAQAMAAWQGLRAGEKQSYNSRAKKLNMTGHNLFISERMKSDDFAEQIKSAGRSLIPMGDDEGSLAQSSHNTVRRPCSWSSPSQPAIPGTGSPSLHLAFPSVTAPSTGIIIQRDDRVAPG